MRTEFTNEQNKVSYPDGIENHWWHLARNKIIAAEIRKSNAAGSRVLDIGCGRGIVVKYLREVGINCSGVEPSNNKPLAGVEGHIVTGMKAEDLPESQRDAVETILLLDVIEHLPDPVAFLADLREYFKNLKYVIVTVPARQELWSRYDEYYGHYRRYTRQMIDQHAKGLNWDLVRQSYFFRSWYLPVMLVTKFLRKRSVENQRPPLALEWIHRLVAELLVVEHRVFSGSIFGTSIIATLIPSESMGAKTKAL